MGPDRNFLTHVFAVGDEPTYWTGVAERRLCPRLELDHGGPNDLQHL